MRDAVEAGSGTALGTARDQRRRVVDRPREPLPTLVEQTPPLPAGYDDALVAGLDKIGVSLSATQRSAIDGHVRLLLAWTGSINLTAVRDPVATATVHVLDSLTGLPWLRDRDIPTLLDIGSGGGFPGLPLAVTMPVTRVTLLEATGKKARFLEVAVQAAGLGDRVSVAAARAEALGRDRSQRGAWSAITARAVASTADLVELAFPLLVDGGSLVAWKRGDLTREVQPAERAMAALGGGRISVLPVGSGIHGLDGHALVIATRTGRHAVPEAYPRDPAVRARRPW